MSANPTVAPAALKAAATKYTGAFSGSLNELSQQEQRARDVASRRHADAKQYAAFVAGQQGAIAAAATKRDQSAVGSTMAIQGMTLGAESKLQQNLMNAHAANGGGPIPAQQLAGLTSDQQRTQAVLGATAQNMQDRANTNSGKAGFLAAAAQQQLMANDRAIAGDEFNQTSAIRRDKVGVLNARTSAHIDDRRAQQQAEAAAAVARMQADSQAADRASRENIAQYDAEARAGENAANRAARHAEGAANRKIRLKTSAITAQGTGYVPPAEARRRTTVVAAEKDSVGKAEQFIDSFKGGRLDLNNPAVLDGLLNDPEAGKLSKQAREYVKAKRLKAKGDKNAGEKFRKHISDLAAGKIAK